jgi:chondroitin 4-sulfotransferase 11
MVSPRMTSKLREARRNHALLSHPFIFIHVPKTGGTSLRTALGMGPAPYHITAQKLRQSFPDSATKFSFAFVRNPWDRLVSYVHSMKNQWERPDRSQQLGGFRPQVHYIMDDDGKPLVDFIGRYENLAEDFHTICVRIGIPTPPLPHLNRSVHRQYRRYYDDDSKRFVAENYAADIERFGYSF